jgi:signal transduction histidine kinase
VLEAFCAEAAKVADGEPPWRAAVTAVLAATGGDGAVALGGRGTDLHELARAGAGLRAGSPQAGSETDAQASLRTRQPLRIDDWRTRSDLQPAATLEAGELRSSLALPVGQDALLIVCAGRPHAFDHEEALRSAGVIAAVLGLAVAALDRQLAAREQERRRLAADIHDDPVQALTVAAMHLTVAASELDGAAADKVAAAQEGVARANRALRQVIADAQPEVLARAGLADALREHLMRACEPRRIACTLEGQLLREPAQDVRLAVFRIAQEAIANALQHAYPTQVTVRLTQDDGGLTLEVGDDGIGFDATNTGTPSADHYGLYSMRERALGLAGRLHVTSGPGAGTLVTFRLPG